jgi:hypothetical protein
MQAAAAALKFHRRWGIAMKTPTNFSDGACSSAAPTSPIRTRQKISAKISNVPQYGSAFFQTGMLPAG